MTTGSKVPLWAVTFQNPYAWCLAYGTTSTTPVLFHDIPLKSWIAIAVHNSGSRVGWQELPAVLRDAHQPPVTNSDDVYAASPKGHIIGIAQIIRKFPSDSKGSFRYVLHHRVVLTAPVQLVADPRVTPPWMNATGSAPPWLLPPDTLQSVRLAVPRTWVPPKD